MTDEELTGLAEQLLARFTAEELRTPRYAEAMAVLGRATTSETYARWTAYSIAADAFARKRHEEAIAGVAHARRLVADALREAARGAKRTRLNALPVAAAYEVGKHGWLRPTTPSGPERHMASYMGPCPQWAHRIRGDGVDCLLYLPAGDEPTDDHLDQIDHAFARAIG